MELIFLVFFFPALLSNYDRLSDNNNKNSS